MDMHETEITLHNSSTGQILSMSQTSLLCASLFLNGLHINTGESLVVGVWYYMRYDIWKNPLFSQLKYNWMIIECSLNFFYWNSNFRQLSVSFHRAFSLTEIWCTFKWPFNLNFNFYSKFGIILEVLNL